MKTRYVVALVVCVVAGGVWALSGDEAPSEPRHPHVAREHGFEAGRLEPTEPSVRVIENESPLPKSVLVESTEVPNERPREADRGEEPAPPETREQLQEHFDDLSAQLDEEFDEQGSDPEWSRSMESNLTDFMAEWPSLRASGLECHASMCRASVDLGDDDTAMAFIEDGIARSPFDGRMRLVPVDSEDELAVTLYYERLDH